MKCTLCDVPLSEQPLQWKEYSFCCPGCRTVYEILSVRLGETGNMCDHPLFHQAVASGLISNPYLLEEIEQEPPPSEILKITCEIEGMWCPACTQVISWTLLKKKGITSAFVDYATDIAVIEYDPKKIGPEEIYEMIRKLAYSAHPIGKKTSDPFYRSLFLRLGIAAFCTLNLMMLSYPVYATFWNRDGEITAPIFSYLTLLLSLPLFYCAYPLFKRAYEALKVRILSMELLVVIAIFSAFSLSTYSVFQSDPHIYFDAMGAIITFVLLGKILELRSKTSSKETLYTLHRSLPKKAKKRLSDHSEAYFPIKEIKIDDEIVVVAGEKIPLDGVVIEGEAVVNESSLSGESHPLLKTVESTVWAGSIVEQGKVFIRVTTSWEHTSQMEILKQVEGDLPQKKETTPFVQKVVTLFVPFVVILSILSFFYSGDILRSISVLLIACPCALGIAAPLAETALLHQMALCGALVRNRRCLSLLGCETLFASDKTGTLTEGQFTIAGLEAVNQPVIKAMALHSRHPICIAIDYALSISPAPLDTCSETLGRGLEAHISSTRYLLGSRSFLASHNIAIDHLPPSNSLTELFFVEGSCVYSLLLCDTLRPDAPLLVQSQSQTLLLSGDREEAVAHVSRACRFDNHLSHLSSQQKRDEIRTLQSQGHTVLMLGDGINDASALACADISISVLQAADMASQVADILLTTNRLTIIPEIQKLARFYRNIQKQNLAWAFSYNIIGIALALNGMLNPLFSAIGMVVSSLAVVLNSKRKKRSSLRS